MNPLEKHPHLFANGKFKVRHDKEDDVYDLVYARPSEDWEWLIHTAPLAWDSANAFTLIARPISDMTDEEWDEWVNSHLILGVDMYEEGLTFSASGRITYNQLWNIIEYPLSIGAYPFDQSHFEDGTVIDATKLEATPE